MGVAAQSLAAEMRVPWPPDQTPEYLAYKERERVKADESGTSSLDPGPFDRPVEDQWQTSEDYDDDAIESCESGSDSDSDSDSPLETEDQQNEPRVPSPLPPFYQGAMVADSSSLRADMDNLLELGAGKRVRSPEGVVAESKPVKSMRKNSHPRKYSC